MARSVFDGKISGVNGYFDRAVPLLNTHAPRLGISVVNLGKLNNLYDKGSVPQGKLGWSQLWVLYSNTATVTPTVRKIVSNRRKQITSLLRAIYADIPVSALRVSDRNTLRIRKRDTNPRPLQPVDFTPTLSFEKVSNGIQVLRIKNPETPDSNAMPYRQKAEVQSFAGEAGLADKAVPFEPLRDTGRHLLQVNYQPAQKGQTAYYRARYKTPTGETGPWSDVQSELVL